MPRAGPSNVARNPSPVVLISLPRNAVSSRRTAASCASSSSVQRRSPSAAARSVERTTSVNMTVARTRSGSSATRVPVRNARTSSTIASVSPAQGKWSWPGSSTRPAPGICSAIHCDGAPVDDAIAVAVQHQCRHVHRRQDVPNVDLEEHLDHRSRCRPDSSRPGDSGRATLARPDPRRATAPRRRCRRRRTRSASSAPRWPARKPSADGPHG